MDLGYEKIAYKSFINKIFFRLHLSIMDINSFEEGEYDSRNKSIGEMINLFVSGNTISHKLNIKEGSNIFDLQKTLENLAAVIIDEPTGIQIVSKAIESPLRTIVENAGGEGSVVINKVLEGKGDFGYDAKSDNYVDMLKAGIIDPKKVTRVALENAASVSGMILTTECALIDIKEDTPAMPPMGGGMPGMM
jgi:chaperonin GroEL (HSP60 family)